MKVILRDRNQGLVDEWKARFKDCPDVEVGCGDIFDIPADAIVSPANSFGFMNGGIDMVYSRRFGFQLETQLQDYLLQNHDGELPVGQAVIVPIGKDEEPYKWLISAPTMRVPMDVSSTVNAFLAMRALLRAAKKHNSIAADDTIRYGKPVKSEIKSILCPGLGTAIGRVPYDIAAHQMREAYRIVIEGKPFVPANIAASWHGHECMRRGLPYNGEDF